MSRVGIRFFIVLIFISQISTNLCVSRDCVKVYIQNNRIPREGKPRLSYFTASSNVIKS